MNASRPVELREMTHADIDAGLLLCRQSHWNQVARDWRQFLDLTPGGAAVALDDAGRVIGSVATMRYGVATSGDIPTPDSPLPTPDSLAWIAMVLVDPVHRGGGIGTTLLQHGLDRVADVTCVGLDATPLGQPLYEKLGFRVDSMLTRMHLAPLPRLGRADRRAFLHLDDVRPATFEDQDAIARLDARATGLDRRAMLAWLQRGAPQLAWVADGPAGLEGVVLGRDGHTASHLGPVIASSSAVAQRLVSACLARQVDRGVVIDVMDARSGWRAAVEALGFEAQRPFARMYRGEWRPAGDTTSLFAAIGPEFG